MSTIFGHGRLRLYLLKLLDESPKHGYEIISLLRDRFLGVYSPSPGTIYPRLSRLEEEGLVTHEEVNGRKVYRLTDKGRAELHSRTGDLDDLEREITESVRDVARAVQRDVRDTISHLREELKFAAGGTRRDAKARKDAPEPEAPGAGSDDVWSRVAGEDDRAGDGEQRGERPEAEREPSGHRRGSAWWERDWEKFAYGIGWGSWGRSGSQEHGQRVDLDRALHDFTDRVRDVVREAGQVGEAAAGDLRRILDDTIDVIRRDAASWGPEGADRPATQEPEATSQEKPRDEWSAATAQPEAAPRQPQEPERPAPSPEARPAEPRAPFAQPAADAVQPEPPAAPERKDEEGRQ